MEPLMRYPKVAVLIVVYNEIKELINLLKDLKKQTYVHYRVYVLNNGSDDNPKEIIKKYFPEAFYMNTGKNLGFGAGNNILAEKAIEEECDYLYILNPDMELNPDTMEKLVYICEGDKKIGMCNCTILFGGDRKNEEIIHLFGCKANYNTQSKKFLYSGLHLKEVKLPDILEVEYINTGSLFIRTEVIKKTGLFDADFFMYNEEIDIGRRVKRAGYKIIVTSRTKIWHNHDYTKNNIVGYKRMYYYMMRNRYLYFYKYKLYLFMILDLLWQIISFPLKFKMFNKIGSLKILKYYYWGIFKGLIQERGKSGIDFSG